MLDAFVPTQSQSGSELVNGYGATKVQEIWESVGVEGKEQPDGSPLVRTRIFYSYWDEPLQIASIQSRPDDADRLMLLGCNLNYVAI